MLQITKQLLHSLSLTKRLICDIFGRLSLETKQKVGHSSSFLLFSKPKTHTSLSGGSGGECVFTLRGLE
ncbi:MAG: hypothetical protein CO029_03710 [Candidatus Magasanikbacteria bacterium CG_4_9_14_0_2_um_filter_41_10]|nr:MAG: hypothetical protein AUJ37_03605 [Candidatus Magasanikbacteria bacterium CG1_02_41_34]PJC53245.1 MAG: hypothetical protein CO029_03710 [Candidatus Magasanikbacteria bacterium CG_4_9_14_0_2_um_filter_41_10]